MDSSHHGSHSTSVVHHTLEVKKMHTITIRRNASENIHIGPHIHQNHDNIIIKSCETGK